jgi:hypothetical protein
MISRSPLFFLPGRNGERACRPIKLVVARLDRAIQSPRPIGSIAGVSGILGRPVEPGDDGGVCVRTSPRKQGEVNDRYFFGGRIASAVSWMKAAIFATSASVSLPVKSGMPWSLNGPLNTKSFRFSIISFGT